MTLLPSPLLVPNCRESSYDEILNAPHVEDSEDEEDVDKADEFESKYNFRFEEVRTYAQIVSRFLCFGCVVEGGEEELSRGA